MYSLVYKWWLYSRHIIYYRVGDNQLLACAVLIMVCSEFAINLDKLILHVTHWYQWWDVFRSVPGIVMWMSDSNSHGCQIHAPVLPPYIDGISMILEYLIVFWGDCIWKGFMTWLIVTMMFWYKQNQ